MRFSGFLSVCLYLSRVCVCVRARASARLSVCRSVCLSLSLSVYMSVTVSVFD